ncbi:MAG: response regulator transcription factor [Actinomycetota bacterium]
MAALKKLLSRFGKAKPGVLVVDDDEDVRMMLRAMLNNEDFGDVWDAPDGETAIALAYQHEPKLIILDYMMPNMDGEAVAKAIRGFLPSSRIVVLSGVLMEQPDWADMFLKKTDITRLIPVLSLERASSE